MLELITRKKAPSRKKEEKEQKPWVTKQELIMVIRIKTQI